MIDTDGLSFGKNSLRNEVVHGLAATREREVVNGAELMRQALLTQFPDLLTSDTPAVRETAETQPATRPLESRGADDMPTLDQIHQKLDEIYGAQHAA